MAQTLVPFSWVPPAVVNLNAISSRNLTALFKDKFLFSLNNTIFSVVRCNDDFVLLQYSVRKKSDETKQDLSGNFYQVEKEVGVVQESIVPTREMRYLIEPGNALLAYDEKDTKKRHFLCVVVGVTISQIHVELINTAGKSICPYSFPVVGEMTFMERFIPIQRGTLTETQELCASVDRRRFIQTAPNTYQLVSAIGYHLTRSSIMEYQKMNQPLLQAFSYPRGWEAIPAKVLD